MPVLYDFCVGIPISNLLTKVRLKLQCVLTNSRRNTDEDREAEEGVRLRDLVQEAQAAVAQPHEQRSDDEDPPGAHGLHVLVTRTNVYGMLRRRSVGHLPEHRREHDGGDEHRAQHHTGLGHGHALGKG